MKAPMILNWLARRAGIGEDDALRVWNAVVADAARRFAGNAGTPAHQAYLACSLRTRIADATAPTLRPPLALLSEYQSRFVRATLAAWLAGSAAWLAFVHRLAVRGG